MDKNLDILANSFKKHKIKAFTLAELMIAVVIIGVIASITIPPFFK